ncbi:MAG TPA: amidase [Capsulimonadaceae bacterium]|nr:amidase [Capsulimonadaceae bacterium]
MIDDDTLYLSIRELSRRIRSRRISPVALTEAYLQRSQRIGTKLNAYALLTPDLALRQAREAEREIADGHYRGPLHGIPYAAKDLLSVKGYPTTWGAPPFAKQRFDYDAAVIEKLFQAGAILIGKAAMIELAGGLGYSDGSASLTGAARNPWNPDCWTCGSSSGSGAIVAAGLANFAIGSDTRGSIICPTSWCGISGLRPSFGRVSRYGAMALAWSMDKLGPMARTADECGIILSAIAGHDPRDHDSLPPALASFPYSSASSRSKRPLRIGKLTNAWVLNPSLESAVDTALLSLEKQGAHIKDARVPLGPYEDVAELTILMETASAFESMLQSGSCAKLRDALGRINGYASEQFSATDYLDVQRIRAILQRRIDALFDEFDVLATAGSDVTAQPLAPEPNPKPPVKDERRPRLAPKQEEEARQCSPDGVSSLCGLPALSVPCGFSKERLPYSLQFIARATNDQAVVSAARMYQSHTEWHRQHPKL